MKSSIQKYTRKLEKLNKELSQLLDPNKSVEKVRKDMLEYLQKLHIYLLNDENIEEYIRLQKIETVQTLLVIFSKRSQNLTGYDTLKQLLEIFKDKSPGEATDISAGFFKEIENFWRALSDLSSPHIQVEAITDKNSPNQSADQISKRKSQDLDKIAESMSEAFNRYPSGTLEPVKSSIDDNRKKIMKYFDAHSKDWNNYKWQITHTVRNTKDVKALIDITPEQEEAIELCNKNKLPFAITPYYLSLINKKECFWDKGIRAQVIPPLNYVKKVLEYKSNSSSSLDFMKEEFTSPIEAVSRRYPQIAIFKPIVTCPQFCVYCQRNWEIEDYKSSQAMRSKKIRQQVYKWYRKHPQIKEVLITGGDPGMLHTNDLDSIIKAFKSIESIKRLRFASRTLVTLPMRFTDRLIKTLSSFNKANEKMLYIVTHIEHSAEITQDTIELVKKLNHADIKVYNQQVMTTFNSGRLQLAKLRWDLKMAGIDPYYTFYPKGKKETKDYRIPISRILQERKEEARLLPGSVRPDEPVFNVPFTGKNHLRARQDRELIAITPKGERIYHMHSWEKNITNAKPYIYTDIPIKHYLEKMEKEGHNPKEFDSIWYYY